MRRLVLAVIGTIVVGAATAAGAAKIVEYLSGKIWPEPRVITPGDNGAPPSDAIVLFDGKDLSQWVGGENWEVADGVATAQKSAITTKQPFGDCQLHIEWATPEKVEGSGQGRGNSGIHFMERYEIQILDSYENPTYPDGSAGALYKQWPPLVNASRKPGEWQTYDILFTGPRFDLDGKLLEPGYVTVIHNGVVVQNHAEIQGSTSFIKAPEYEPHDTTAPLSLQFHRNPVRFRNIWIREL
ncbi:MAG TPA: DUF1080 domain-containing protein [Pirellulales bacterium]|jgi:hypothetical protein|nr:DUF1080 domain-containing protein [Pirellulales bacterium]